MKKVIYNMPLVDNNTRTVTGYELLLPTGHLAVVHKSLNGIGWAMTLKESGLLVESGFKTRKEAVTKGIEQIKNMDKDRLDYIIRTTMQKLKIG